MTYGFIARRLAVDGYRSGKQPDDNRIHVKRRVMREIMKQRMGLR
jgi:hypothetical protein